MSTENGSASPPPPGGGNDDQSAVKIEKLDSGSSAAFWQAAGPHVEKIVDAGIRALEAYSTATGQLTAFLLGLVIVCFSGLAWIALAGGHVDTAEKIMIALVSFLGGAAMFSGTPKK